ncbi:hypothetical protein BH20ACT9_BH20ACT9_15870 [soil metagenome]
MITLRLEHAISDFDLWKAAFDRDPVDRAGSGVRGHRIHRPVDDPAYVLVDLDFDTVAAAEAFRGALEQLWQSREAAPALAGRPQVRITEAVETETY